MLFRSRHTTSILCASLLCFTANAQTHYTLQRALQTARVNNPVLKTERFDINIAQADVVTAKLRPNLILNNETLQLTQPSQFPANSGWHSGQNRQVWWQLTKAFQVAGQRRYKIEVADRNAAFTEENYYETERNLLLEVAEKWLEVWTAEKQLDILTTARGNIDSLVTINQARYRNQVITETDLSRTELLSKQYAIQHKTARQELANRQEELRFLAGVPDSIRVDTADNFLFHIPTGIDSLLAQSLQNRSDILTAKSLIDISDSNIKLQKSLAYPQPELGFIWNPQNAVPYFGVSATIDLPFSNRNQGEIKKSYLLKDQAEQYFSAIQSQLESEVAPAYASYGVQQRNIRDFQTVLQQSQTVLDNVKYAYTKGGTTVIDFLEAQRSWLETQQQYYDALQQHRRSYIQLLHATGLINQLAQ